MTNNVLEKWQVVTKIFLFSSIIFIFYFGLISCTYFFKELITNITIMSIIYTISYCHLNQFEIGQSFITNIIYVF